MELSREAARGFYLHPELFGQSDEKGIESATNPDGMRTVKQLRERASQPVQ